MTLCFSLGGGWGRIFFRVLYLLLAAVGLLAVHGPSLVVLSEDYSLAGCSGFTLSCWALRLQQLWHRGLTAPWCVGSSWNRD